MVAFKGNKAMRSDVITRGAELITDKGISLGYRFFGRLLASTNGAGKRSLAWSQGRERFAFEMTAMIYTTQEQLWSVRQHTKPERQEETKLPSLNKRMAL